MLRAKSDEVIAIGLLVAARRKRGPLWFRQAYLNTDGEPASDSLVIENNMLLAYPAARDAAFRMLADNVERLAVHEFNVSGVADEQLRGLISAFPSWSPDITCRESPFVDLSSVREAGGDLLPLLSANTRAQIRRAVRKYEQEGTLRLDVAQTSAQALDYLEELKRLHEVRWAPRGKSGAFASVKRRLFHTAFVQEAVPGGHATLLRVRVGDSTIGVLYSLTGHGRVNFYQSGFLIPDDPHLKPGLVSHYLAIRHFAEAGFTEYDFLTSDPHEARYKLSLATSSRSLYWISFARPCWRNTALRAFRRFRQK